MVSLVLVLLTFGRRLRGALGDPEFRSIALMVIALLGVGTAFYTNVEGWNPLDALYFSVVTLATVGYGDFAPKTPLGKIFTMMYLMLGIGVIVVFADRLVRANSQPGGAVKTPPRPKIGSRLRKSRTWVKKPVPRPSRVEQPVRARR